MKQAAAGKVEEAAGTVVVEVGAAGTVMEESEASEDEEGGLRSSPRIYDNAFNSSSSRIFDKAFSASNVVDLRLETERLTSMVSFLIFQSEQSRLIA